MSVTCYSKTYCTCNVHNDIDFNKNDIDYTNNDLNLMSLCHLLHVIQMHAFCILLSYIEILMLLTCALWYRWLKNPYYIMPITHT